MNRWVRLAWPLGVLLVFVLTVDRLERPGVARAGDAADCELPAGAPIADLERCLALGPDDVELMTDLAGREDEAGQGDRAEALYRRALTIDPDNGDVHVRLGELLRRRGDLSSAGREGQAALAVEPNSPAALALVAAATAGGGSGR